MFEKIQNKKLFIVSILCFIVSISFFIFGKLFFIPCEDFVHLNNIENIPYIKFQEYLTEEQINTIYFSDSTDSLYLYTTDNIYYKTSNPEYENFKKELLEHNIIIKNISELKTAEQVESSRLGKLILFFLLGIVISIVLFTESLKEKENSFFLHKEKIAANGISSNSVKKNITKNQDKNHIKLFSDIAGLTEVKKDLKCIVDFLVNKEKYTEAGASLPKGIILYGPPGTGKTLLAKAIAGEADVPFLYASGSDFVEMYVGVGAKRIREIFDKAKKQSPCIIFIDEIDAIGGKRTSNDNGEDRKTLNALLTEMDGFHETENIIIIGATNRLEDLDPALTRAGRFTNKYCVPLPETASERLEIIQLYLKNKRIDESLDLNSLAKETVGFSPAKIEALLNEASIISVQENSYYITTEIIEKAMYKILLQGHMKEDNSGRNEEELKVVAWHEAGHAVIGKLFNKDITKVTIVSSTSGAGGVTFSTPTKTHLLSSEDIRHEIMELYGGRVAEYLFYDKNIDKITTGASNDIERASSIIHDYVTKYGMSKTFGLLNLESTNADSKMILDNEIQLAKELEKETLDLLLIHFDKLKNIANCLLQKETIYSHDINEFFAN